MKAVTLTFLCAEETAGVAARPRGQCLRSTCRILKLVSRGCDNPALAWFLVEHQNLPSFRSCLSQRAEIARLMASPEPSWTIFLWAGHACHL